MGFFFKLLLKAGFTIGIMVIGYKFILPAMMGTGGFELPGVVEEATDKLDGIGNSITQEDVTVYQWVDDKGITHYGGTPPTGQGEYEKKTISANTNLMQAQKAPQQEEEKPGKRSRVAKIGSIYSPEGIKDTIDSAKDLQGEANERAAEQEKILNDIMDKTVGKKR
ncbi:hypothetical protein MNBD_GAMMA10-666 [hydrothermal vent metagenome]|uniref:DUF4124 domain-containing protein n=1 Tax=hydrothermal vent metagenome TaxID=652676 RepID=A0A3B0Y667_9ZZZZ